MNEEEETNNEPVMKGDEKDTNDDEQDNDEKGGDTCTGENKPSDNPPAEVAETGEKQEESTTSS